MRLTNKIEEIEKFLSELEEISPDDFETYQTDIKTKAACERYFEKIVEALVDLAYVFIKENALKMPEDDKEAFDILAEAGHIPIALAIKLKEAKGMRNIISHQYGTVDDETVFEAITHELVKDAREFIGNVRKKLI